jgi:metallo-beta-lactamase family protein
MRLYNENMTIPVDHGRSPATVTSWGAAGNVAGSMHLVECAGYRLLLDCGLIMGHRAEARHRNEHFPFSPDSINAVALSHAHVDHCGNLPTLVRQGFRGPVYCTPATRDLLPLMLADSAKIQEEDAAWLYNSGAAGKPVRPLYDHLDAEHAVDHCVTVSYDCWTMMAPGVAMSLLYAGHLLGSAMIHLRLAGAGAPGTVLFTGDLGRRGLPFLRDPVPVPAADVVLCESTYGGRFHPPLGRLREALRNAVRGTVERGGKVLIPAFSLGRAQVVVHFLNQGMQDGSLPRVPIFVDSGLAADVAAVYQKHLDELAVKEAVISPGEDDRGISNVRYVRSVEESRRLSTRRDSCVIVASGGMCEAGRIMNHFRHNIDDPRCSILLVSYQAPQSLGRKLLERGPVVYFDGKRWNKWAEVVDLTGFSGHADHDDLLKLLSPTASETKKVRLVHGEVEAGEALARSLRAAGFADVDLARYGESVEVGD